MSMRRYTIRVVYACGVYLLSAWAVFAAPKVDPTDHARPAPTTTTHLFPASAVSTTADTTSQSLDYPGSFVVAGPTGQAPRSVFMTPIARQSGLEQEWVTAVDVGPLLEGPLAEVSIHTITASLTSSPPAQTEHREIEEALRKAADEELMKTAKEIESENAPPPPSQRSPERSPLAGVVNLALAAFVLLIFVLKARG